MPVHSRLIKKIDAQIRETTAACLVRSRKAIACRNEAGRLSPGVPGAAGSLLRKLLPRHLAEILGSISINQDGTNLLEAVMWSLMDVVFQTQTDLTSQPALSQSKEFEETSWQVFELELMVCAGQICF